MSGEWFRDLVDHEATAREERRPPSRGRAPRSMRKPSSSAAAAGPKSGAVTPQIACLAAVVLAVSLATLLYTSVLLSPALMRAAVKDVMCDTPDVQESATPAAERASGAPEKISILLGVFTTAASAERRSLLRIAYGVQPAGASPAAVTVRFVVGKPRGEGEELVVVLEALHYGDILVLDCEENMNHGKSFSFFATVAAGGARYDYVMKADDDSYIRLPNLADSLFAQPRRDLYYGYVLPCESDDAFAWYMAGMGYVISWDLVEWVRDSPIPRNRTQGTEDQLMGDWLNAGGKAKHRVSKKPLFYDHPEFGGKCAHAFVPETILVHQLKTPERWHDVLAFFERGRIPSAAMAATPDKPT